MTRLAQPEFDCVECGKHIIGFGPGWSVALCAHCMFCPGWFRDPRLLKMWAPEGLDNLPVHEAKR
jgi:hypothetical protein